MSKLRILHVVGARPNFMKVAPVRRAMARRPDRFEQILVHTGQHYDECMSSAFFVQLGLPAPDDYLNAGAGSHAQQTAKILSAFEPVVLRRRPDWVFVVGDVNSSLACALACAKLGIKTAHVEAGLRSRDRGMPEEINRILIDHMSDLLFTPSLDANANLAGEGVDGERVRFVGNVMIDSLAEMLPRLKDIRIVEQLGLKPHEFALVTLHRPANVDDPASLDAVLATLGELSLELPVVFPVHPRTRQRLAEANKACLPPRLALLEPLDYMSFLALMASARLVITDSGGVQEETTYLSVPCLTFRANTERPVTIACGTNRLVSSAATLLDAARETLSAPLPVRGRVPDFWDGRAADRIVNALLAFCGEDVSVASASGFGKRRAVA